MYLLELETLLKKFNIILRTINLYPETSPFVDKSLDDFFQLLKSLLGKKDIRFSVTKDNLHSENEIIGPGNKQIIQLVLGCYSRGIQKLSTTHR